MTSQRKRRSRNEGTVLESQQHEQETEQQQSTDEEQIRSFDNPMPMGPELARIYEEHKKELAGVSGPYIPRTTREEDELIFARMDNLGKRERRNPERNFDLMPEKQVAEEELPKGDDEGTTFVL